MDVGLVPKPVKPKRKGIRIAILATIISFFILSVSLITYFSLRRDRRRCNRAKSYAAVPLTRPVVAGVALPSEPKTEPVTEANINGPFPIYPSSHHPPPQDPPPPLEQLHPHDVHPPPLQLCVVSYNIRCNKDPPPFDLPNRIKHIAKVIDDLDCDVLCLQEATELFCSRIFNSTLSAAHWQTAGRARRRNDETTCIVYRTDILSLCHESTYVYSDNGPFLCAQSYCQSETILNMKSCSHVRIFTHAILKHNRTGKIVNIVNTHFPLEEDEQRECLAQLGSHVAHNIPKNEDLIIAGDFNSHFTPCASSSPFAILYTSIPGLDEVLGMRDEPTFTEGFQSPLNDNCHRLDFIFFRRSTLLDSLIHAQVCHPRYTGEAWGRWQEAQYRPSDHEPVLARFQVM